MSTEQATTPGTTRGRAYCCDARGDTVFYFEAERRGDRWYTAEGRKLQTFLTEMFHETQDVKQVRLVVPAQNLKVFFRLVCGQAKAIYAEPLEMEQTEKLHGNRCVIFDKPNLGGVS